MLLATALVDKPGWQVGLGVGTAIIGAVVGFEYAQFRTKTDSGGPPGTAAPSEYYSQTGDGVQAVNRPTATVAGSRNTIDQSQTQITHDHRQTITITSPERRPVEVERGGIDRFLEELGVAGVLILGAIAAYLVNAAFANVANFYVDARSRALLVLLLLASATTGLAIGAWLGLRRHTHLDRSWRKPLIAAALASLLTFATIWLLSHPLLRIGTLHDVLRPFETNRGHILRVASRDHDATTFLAFQGLGVVLAAATCVIALFLMVLVWSNVEAQLPYRSWFVFAAIHWAFRKIPAHRLLTVLPAVALMAAAFASGLFNWIPGNSFSPERPRLTGLTAHANASEVHLSVRVDKPVVVRAEVRRLHRGGKLGIPLGRAKKDCRPSRTCKMTFTSRTDSGPLAPGRYELQVRATDENGKRSRATHRTFVVHQKTRRRRRHRHRS